MLMDTEAKVIPTPSMAAEPISRTYVTIYNPGLATNAPVPVTMSEVVNWIPNVTVVTGANPGPEPGALYNVYSNQYFQLGIGNGTYQGLSGNGEHVFPVSLSLNFGITSSSKRNRTCPARRIRGNGLKTARRTSLMIQPRNSGSPEDARTAQGISGRTGWMR